MTNSPDSSNKNEDQDKDNEAIKLGIINLPKDQLFPVILILVLLSSGVGVVLATTDLFRLGGLLAIIIGLGWAALIYQNIQNSRKANQQDTRREMNRKFDITITVLSPDNKIVEGALVTVIGPVPYTNRPTNNDGRVVYTYTGEDQANFRNKIVTFTAVSGDLLANKEQELTRQTGQFMTLVLKRSNSDSDSVSSTSDTSNLNDNATGETNTSSSTPSDNSPSLSDQPLDVFISYARADAHKFSKQLHDELESQGLSVWLDTVDIQDGADWDASIDHALLNTRSVVVIVTPGSNLSLQVKSEWIAALNRYLPVIPVLLSGKTVPRVLGVLNYIDFRDEDSHKEKFTQLIQRLQDISSQHLEYLKEILAAFEAAQDEAEDKSRFDEKINDLKLSIKNYRDGIDLQNKRINEALASDTGSNIGQPTSKVPTAGHRPNTGVTNFYDRELELQDILQLVQSPHTRLISLVGQGGIGKTALAGKFLDGLQHHASRINVKGIIALSVKTKGISPERLFLDTAELFGEDYEAEITGILTDPKLSMEDKFRKLFGYFKQGVYIILLDNFEDLLDESGNVQDTEIKILIEQGLNTENNVKLLVTTRIALQLDNKYLSHNQYVSIDEGLPVSDALQMLKELDPNGDYGIKTLSDEQLDKIVSTLHGIPRALEVFVGILANDPFSRVGDLVENFYEKERVVEDLVEDSYKRLDLPSRRVLDALAVFVRPVSTNAVDILLQPFFPGINVPDILQRLWRTHIINIDRDTSLISLHPINRDYSYNSIPKDGSEYNRLNLEKRAADYYAQGDKNKGKWENFRAIEPQLLRFQHLINAQAFMEATATINEIDYDYLARWGYTQRAKEMREELIDKIPDVKLHAENFVSLGRLSRSLGSYQQSIQYTERGLEVENQLDALNFHYALRNLGYSNLNLGQFDDALIALRRSLEVARSTSDIESEFRALGALGVACLDAGQYEEAKNHIENGSTIAADSNNEIELAYQQLCLGRLHIELGRVPDADQALGTALAISRDKKHIRLEADCLGAYSNMYLIAGDYDEAVLKGLAGAKIAQDFHAERIECTCLGYLGVGYFSRGDVDLAIERLQGAREIADRILSAPDSTLWRMKLAEIYIDKGDLSQAISHIDEAVTFNVEKYLAELKILKGVVGLLNDQDDTSDSFVDALNLLSNLNNNQMQSFHKLYLHALAQLGLTLSAVDIKKREENLAKSIASIKVAVSYCSQKGVLDNVMRLLNLLNSKSNIENVIKVINDHQTS